MLPAVQSKASSTHMHFRLKRNFYSTDWPAVHKYKVKTVTENATFQIRSQERKFLNTLFSSSERTPKKNEDRVHRISADEGPIRKRKVVFQTKTDACGR